MFTYSYFGREQAVVPTHFKYAVGSSIYAFLIRTSYSSRLMRDPREDDIVDTLPTGA